LFSPAPPTATHSNIFARCRRSPGTSWSDEPWRRPSSPLWSTPWTPDTSTRPSPRNGPASPPCPTRSSPPWTRRSSADSHTRIPTRPTEGSNGAAWTWRLPRSSGPTPPGEGPTASAVLTVPSRSARQPPDVRGGHSPVDPDFFGCAVVFLARARRFLSRPTITYYSSASSRASSAEPKALPDPKSAVSPPRQRKPEPADLLPRRRGFFIHCPKATLECLMRRRLTLFSSNARSVPSGIRLSSQLPKDLRLRLWL
jgi:hypothetical protein